MAAYTSQAQIEESVRAKLADAQAKSAALRNVGEVEFAWSEHMNDKGAEFDAPTGTVYLSSDLVRTSKAGISCTGHELAHAISKEKTHGKKFTNVVNDIQHLFTDAPISMSNCLPPAEMLVGMGKMVNTRPPVSGKSKGISGTAAATASKTDGTSTATGKSKPSASAGSGGPVKGGGAGASAKGSQKVASRVDESSDEAPLEVKHPPVKAKASASARPPAKKKATPPPPADDSHEDSEDLGGQDAKDGEEVEEAKEEEEEEAEEDEDDGNDSVKPPSKSPAVKAPAAKAPAAKAAAAKATAKAPAKGTRPNTKGTSVDVTSMEEMAAPVAGGKGRKSGASASEKTPQGLAMKSAPIPSPHTSPRPVRAVARKAKERKAPIFAESPGSKRKREEEEEEKELMDPTPEWKKPLSGGKENHTGEPVRKKPKVGADQGKGRGKDTKSN